MKLLLSLFLVIFLGKENILAQTASEYFQKGMAENQQERFEEAVENFTKAIALAPKISEGYKMRGFAQSKLHKIKDAIADYQQALLLNPNDAWTCSNKGFLHLKIGEYRTAVQDLKLAIGLYPQNAWDYFYLAEAKYQLIQKEIALRKSFTFFEIVADYSQAIALKPDFAKAFLKRGQARYDSLKTSWHIPTTQEVESICQDWQKAVQLGENQASVWIERYCGKRFLYEVSEKAFKFAEQKELDKLYQQAEIIYSQIIQAGLIDSPYFVQALRKRAELKTLRRDWVGAIEDLTSLIALQNLDKLYLGSVLFQRALLSTQMQNYSKAIDDLNQAIDRGYTHSWVYEERGNVQLLLNQTQAACADWKIAQQKGSITAMELLEKYCNVRGRKK